MEKMEQQDEMNGVVLYLDYDNGTRSVRDFNEKLSKHYNRTINLDKTTICKILQERSHSFAGKFKPEDIID